MLGDTTAFSSFSVDDTGAARTFYEDVLGLEVVDGPMDGLLGVRLGSGATVMVYEKGEGHQPASFTVLHFPVTDLPGTVDALAAKGVTFERYADLGEVDERGIHSAPDGGPGIAWFTDPAGNVIAVLADEGLSF
jgi:catechol 2,3-dioxygenase-like lactoylglutathione lyase family enzyme